MWGAWHDRHGGITIPLSLMALSVSLLTQLPAPLFGTFLAGAALMGFSFGACFVLYAAELASWLGHHNAGRFYPLIFLSYGAAGILGPGFGGLLYDISGSFTPAVLAASGMALIAAGASRLIGRSGSPEELITAVPAVYPAPEG